MTTYHYTCIDCGREFDWKYYKAPKRRRCLDCAVKYMLEAQRQISQKSGPIYERWRINHEKGLRRYWHGLSGMD